MSFRNGVEVPRATAGSTRPDYYRPATEARAGESIEIKNYDLTTTRGQNRLVDNSQLSCAGSTRAASSPLTPRPP